MPNIKFYDNAFDSADLKIKTCASSYRTARVTKLITPAKNILYKYIRTFYHTDVYILLAKTTAAQNEDALSHYRVRGLYFLAVVSVRSIYELALHVFPFYTCMNGDRMPHI